MGHEAARKIIHVDMDAFYASVEQRDDPTLRGKPVIVGGAPDSRGVVCTCSYEARKYGIRSAMACSKAYRLCPHGIFLRPRFHAYKEISNQIREIFHDYTDLVEPLSLDEAYLDVTVNHKGIPSATWVAQQIRARITQQTALTASAGVSFNMFLAKVASDINKPDGLCVIPPAHAEAFLEQLPVRKFFGIGKVTEQRMHDLGIRSGSDIKQMSLAELVSIFGKSGQFYYNIVRGIDHRQVNPTWIRKSLGKEVTLSEDCGDEDEMHAILGNLAEEVEDGLLRAGLSGRTVTLKLKYANFQSITRSISLDQSINQATEIMHYIPALLKETEAGQRKVRLLGVTVSNFPEQQAGDSGAEWYQPDLPFKPDDF